MLPRGIRNNNPLNIRRSKDQWQGLKREQTDSQFCQFEDLVYGWRAAFKLLTRTYYHTYRLYTIRAIVNKWAPQTNGYSPRRAAGYSVGESCPLDSVRCSDGNSREWHYLDRLVRHVARVGDGKRIKTKKKSGCHLIFTHRDSSKD